MNTYSNVNSFDTINLIVIKLLNLLIFLFLFLFLVFSMIETRDLSNVVNFPVSTRYVTPLLFLLVTLRVQKINFNKYFIFTLYLFLFIYILGYFYYVNYHNTLQYFYLNAGLIKMLIFTMNIYLLYIYKDYFYSKKIIIFILSFILMITFIAFAIYLYMNSIGLIPFSFNKILILSDFNSRFSGTFSEPNKLGFIFGVVFFTILIEFKNRIKYILAFLILLVFYFYIQAKFSLLALPLALIISYILMHSKKSILTNNTKIVITFLAVIIFSIIVKLGFDETVLDIFKKYISENSINTFVTRIGFLLQSFKHLLNYPIGSGFGGYVVTSSPFLDEFTRYGMSNGMDIWELRSYVDSPSYTFGPKDSLSFIIFSSGITGLYFVFFLIFRLLKKLLLSNSYLLLALFLFIVTNACVAIEIFELSLSSYFIVYIIYKSQKRRNQIEATN